MEAAGMTFEDIPEPQEPDEAPPRSFEDTTLQSFDIDHPEFDRVAIFRAETPDEEGREYYAVPFIHELHLPDSYNEPVEWEADETYREAVLEEALVPAENLRLEPHTLPTYGFDEVDPDDLDEEVEVL